jgi:hypothetical protein
MEHTMRDLLSRIDAIVNETELNPRDMKGDYDAKKKALQDLAMDPETEKDPDLKAELARRTASLDKEAQAKGVKETTDHEARMARAELVQIAKNAKIIFENIKEGEELMGWVSSYITLANDHLNSVAESLEYKSTHGEE